MGGKPCPKLSNEDEETVCRVVEFGLSGKGRQFDGDINYLVRKGGIHCDADQIPALCADHTWPICNAMKSNEKTALCEQFLGAGMPAKTVAANAGARFGVQCSVSDVRTMCEKTTCASLSDRE